MRYFLICSILATSLISHAPAQTPAKVHVITRNIEPFSFEKDGKRTGFAMELWADVARELKLDYDVSVTDSAKQMVDAVQNKTADVAVSALSITAEREMVIDFSQPFYESGLQILVLKKSSGTMDTITQILGEVFTWQLLAGCVIALLVMFFVSHLVWMYEHPVNEDMWPKSYLAGMGESFWWTVSIFLVGGADNKGPVGLGGRIIATVWMVASVIAVSLLTALLSAAFTVNSLASDINGPDDLPGKTVATIKGSTSEAWLQKNSKITIKTYADTPACIAALKSGEVKAVVYDAPILKYWMTKLGPNDFLIVGSLFEKSNYGFALQQDSLMRERVNQVLLNLNEDGVTDDLKKKWFGDEP